MASYDYDESDAMRLSDVDAPPLSSASSCAYFYDLDDSDALRQAARAGILLLEANQELRDEIDALRAQLAVLEHEQPSLRAALAARDSEVAGLTAERGACLVEINALRNELTARAAVVTDALNREQQWRTEVAQALATKCAVEQQLATLEQERHVSVEQQQQQQQQQHERNETTDSTGTSPMSVIQLPSLSSAQQQQQDEQPFVITNPAATYDVHQTSVFTWTDYAKLQRQALVAATEREALQLELKSARKELDSARKQAAHATELYTQLERVEKRSNRLEVANAALSDELVEERAVLESLRTMNAMYKQLAESSQSFPVTADPALSATTTTATGSIANARTTETTAQGLGATVQDVLLDTNMRLETELRELRARLALYERLEHQLRVNGSTSDSSDAVSCDSDSDDGSSHTHHNTSSSRTSNSRKRAPLSANETQALAVLERQLRRVSSTTTSDECASSDTASSSDCSMGVVGRSGVHGNRGDNSCSSNSERPPDSRALAALAHKAQELQEKLRVAQDVLKHTKLQWGAAVASQKALEQSNCAAQDEIARLTTQLAYQIAALASGRGESASNRADPVASPVATRRTSRNSVDAADTDVANDKWVEETASYPAPPGDLNSPLIKCLLDHWTTDRAKIMALTDWLHHAIRGTGKSTPLRLEALASEVAAGFAQLLVPMLRERHGVAVAVYRRDSVHVLSDLVLQTTQSGVATAAAAAAAIGAVSERDSASAASSGAHSSSIASIGSASTRAVAATPSEVPATVEQQSLFLRGGEAQFLYG